MKKYIFSVKWSPACLIIALAMIISVSTVNAQTGSVDLSFNAVPAKSTDQLGGLAIQPDGKILTYGGVRIYEGVLKKQIARLNADGSLDNSFDCAGCDFNISSVQLQTDGKIVVAGSTDSSLYRIQRLNADGSIDVSFNAPSGTVSSSSAVVHAIQTDGKILISTSFFSGNLGGSSLFRLNADGSLDGSFPKIDYPIARFPVYVGQVKLQADGKIVVLINTAAQTPYRYGTFIRYNTNGTVDSTFESPTISSTESGNPYSINSFDIQPDGNIVFAGRFTAVNSVSRTGIARIMPAGNVDLYFSQTSPFTTNENVGAVKVLPDGKILLIATPVTVPAFPPPATPPSLKILRLNADGSLDSTYNAPTNIVEIRSLAYDAQGKILLNGGFLESGNIVYKTVRLGVNGAIESVLNIQKALPGTISVLASQSDGKALIGGNFNLVNNISRSNFARVNADGSLDTTFNSGSGFDVVPTKIIVQPDGKILVGGSFSNYNGTTRAGFVRLNSDGSLDAAFAPILNDGAVVRSYALQANGKILIGGDFTIVNGQTRNGIALLNADGSLDAAFNPIFGSATINSVVALSDGKFLVGGSFSGVSGFNRSNLVRLNGDGTLDSGFNAGSVPTVNQIKIQANGKYLVLTTALLVINAAGTTETTFQTPSILDYLPQPDGSVIIGGNFSSGSQPNIRRIKADGSTDALFLPNGANGAVNALAQAGSGKVLAGGIFSSIGGVTRIGIARLNVSPVVAASRAPLFDFDGDGRADVSVFRPSNGYWYTSQNAAVNYGAFIFGFGTDRLVPADYDGDGKTDIAVFRPSNGYWYIQGSQSGFRAFPLGVDGDVPVPADYDGDGKADIAMFRPSNGTWYIQRSTLGLVTIAFGAGTDKPVPGDYDGDGKAEVAVFRPSTGYWYTSQNPAINYGAVLFGVSEDRPIPADYDGDGKTDIAVFRPSSGSWYLLRSSQGFTGVAFGLGTDLPVPADYDGDGKADIAVFRSGNWYLLRSTAGFTGIAYGADTDKPVPNVYVR